MEIFTAILGALPTLGPIGLVLLILAYVGWQWMSSDSRYKGELERLRNAHDRELERINVAHDEELKELRSDILELRRDLDSMRIQLDTETDLRRKAEEEAHRARLRSGNES